MKRSILLLIILFLVGVFPRAYALPVSDTPKEKYRIGVILALSGDAAAVGKAAQNGMLMALASLPTEDSSRLAIKFEDDGLRTANSVSAFRKLVDIDKVHSIVCWSSGTCNAVAPLAEAAEIPLVAIASDSAVSKGRKFVVNFWVTPEEETRVLVPEAVRRGYRNVAIVATTQDGMLATRDAFKHQSQGQINIAYEEDFPSDFKDFRSTVSRIAGLKKVDAVLMLLMPGQVGTFAKQLRQAGVKVPFFGYETFEDEGEVQASGGALFGSWYSTAATGDTSFVEEYRKRFPGAMLITANNGFDAISLLATASRHGTSGETVATFLRTVRDFIGASGKFSATGDNRFSLPAALKYVAQDGFKELT